MKIKAIAAHWVLARSTFRAFILLDLPHMTELADAALDQEGWMTVHGDAEGWPPRTRGTMLDLYVPTGCEGDECRRGFVVWRAPLFDADLLEGEGPPYGERRWAVNLVASSHFQDGLCIDWRRETELPAAQ